MKTYDWIVVGGGITGAALSYELAKVGLTVLLVEQDASPQNATRYSYGGIAYWSGTDAVTRQLYAEGISRHRILSQELETNTQFRELDLLLTIDLDEDPHWAIAFYSKFAIQPQLLSVAEACALEPLLNPAAIAGALTVKHGNVRPEIITSAYIRAFMRAGGHKQIEQVTGLLSQNRRITGITSNSQQYCSSNVVICAGADSRTLLQAAGMPVKLYFTHAELIEIPACDVQMRSQVMPAKMKWFDLEAESSTAAKEQLWHEPDREISPPIIDAGAVQFIDGSLRLGQLSRAISNPNAKIDAAKSEAAIRASIGRILPELANLSGKWHHCLVAFGCDRLPLIGTIPSYENIHVFSGFSSPFATVPALAPRFARWAIGQDDEVINQLLIKRR
ncbi:NAD(P)/FAD-dependent oxidoreductase [Aliterella atlantica]|uniref:FAD-dependent oxidoreductase n=1 Tax=Aliterella atlantica CENA595 TaxID=1618023 RepID=A0A0D8ZM11_9CYAN|nr:FAD-binding oxidoreductase [Aliterella atlantica]KJH69412.1 FAD-dependent oxidoreductase [Aliterella atlantica CENA595]